MNAIVRHYAALLPGGVDGVQLLPDDRIREITERQRLDCADESAYPSDWTLGYNVLMSPSPVPEAVAFGHGGYGGSIGLADWGLNLAVDVTKNFFRNEDTTGRIVAELRRAVSEDDSSQAI